MRLRLGSKGLVPPDVPTLGPGDVLAGTAYDQHVSHRGGSQLDRLVDGWLERHGRATAVAPVGGDDHRRLGVGDAGAQRLGGEPAEDDRVGRSDPGAGQHRDRRLGDHREVDRDPVAGPHAQRGQRVRGLRHLALQVGVGDVAGVARLTLEVDGDLVTVASCHVPVDAVDGDVEPPTDEPLGEGCPGPVEDGVPGPVPLQVTCLLGPEAEPVARRRPHRALRSRWPGQRSPARAGSGVPRAAGSPAPRGSTSLLGVVKSVVGRRRAVAGWPG